MENQLERQHKLGREAFDLGGHVERRDGTDRACSRPDESLRLMQQVRCISHRSRSATNRTGTMPAISCSRMDEPLTPSRRAAPSMTCQTKLLAASADDPLWIPYRCARVNVQHEGHTSPHQVDQFKRRCVCFVPKGTVQPVPVPGSTVPTHPIRRAAMEAPRGIGGDNGKTTAVRCARLRLGSQGMAQSVMHRKARFTYGV